MRLARLVSRAPATACAPPPSRRWRAAVRPPRRRATACAPPPSRRWRTAVRLARLVPRPRATACPHRPSRRGGDSARARHRPTTARLSCSATAWHPTGLSPEPWPVRRWWAEGRSTPGASPGSSASSAASRPWRCRPRGARPRRRGRAPSIPWSLPRRARPRRRCATGGALPRHPRRESHACRSGTIPRCGAVGTPGAAAPQRRRTRPRAPRAVRRRGRCRRGRRCGRKTWPSPRNGSSAVRGHGSPVCGHGG